MSTINANTISNPMMPLATSRAPVMAMRALSGSDMTSGCGVAYFRRPVPPVAPDPPGVPVPLSNRLAISFAFSRWLRTVC